MLKKSILRFVFYLLIILHNNGVQRFGGQAKVSYFIYENVDNTFQPDSLH